jgi:hypothetical protein
MVIFVFMVGDVVMHVTSGLMVVFGDIVNNMVMRLTGVNGGVMVVFVFLFGDVVIRVTGVTGMSWWSSPSWSAAW